jgi:hypothetical protein
VANQDDAAARLAAMFDPPSPDAADPNAPPATPPPTPSVTAHPKTGIDRPMATPQPRPKAPIGPSEPPATDANLPRQPVRRELPKSPAGMTPPKRVLTAREKAHQVMASSGYRAVLMPPVLTLGVLLMLTGFVSMLAGERLVLGSIPVWTKWGAVLVGAMLVAVAGLNAWQLRRDQLAAAR